MKAKVFCPAALVLLAMLVISGTVFAEGEVLPAAPEEPAETLEAAPPAEAALLDEVAVPAEPVAVDTPLEPAPKAAEAETPVLEPLLVNASGDPLLLATEASADLLENTDPYFSVGATKYCFVPVIATCDASCNVCEHSATPIQASIDYINTSGIIPTNGRVYVEKATYSGNVTVDGSRTYLDQVTGMVGLPSGGLFPTISGSLSLLNLTNGFTLLGLNVSGGILVEHSENKFVFDMVSGNLFFDSVDAYGAGGHGIYIKNHKGNITMEDVDANNNSNLTGDASGLFIENMVSGTVTIRLSDFYENQEHGIYFLNNKGMIILNDIGVFTNGEKGLTVETPNLYSMTITDSFFYNNTSAGIKLDGPGSIIIDNVSANENANGINVLGGFNSLVIKNTEVEDNWASGIKVDGTGKPVSLENITAIGNNYGWQSDNDGIRLNNVGTVVARNIIANYNNYNGINIYAPNSLVTLIGAVAKDNNSAGIIIESRGAILKNIVANDNDYDEGISVYLSGGSALLENVVASENYHEGVEIEAYPGIVTPVVLKDVNANGNEETGIDITVLGPVTLTNIGVNDTNGGGDGIYISTNGAVNIKNAMVIWNEGNGIYVRTRAAISLFGIVAQENYKSGVDLDNCLYDGTICLGTGGISVKNASGKMNEFSRNGYFGLWVETKGAIMLTNALAYDNDADGVFLTNRRGGSIAPITVNTLGGVRNDFSGNGKNDSFYPLPDPYMVLNNGLSALSAGNITVTNTDAYENENEGDGMVLDTKFSTAPRTVTLTNSNTSDNDYPGIVIFSRGNIILANVISDNNANGGGIRLDNCLDWLDVEDGVCVGSGSIKLTNVKTSWNQGIGLEVDSKGTITANSLYSSGNRNNGIFLFNQYTGSIAGMLLNGITAEDNGYTGIDLTTNGSLVMANMNALGNALTHWGMDVGSTVQNFYNENHGEDHWGFDAVPGTAYTFYLRADSWDGINPFDFDPYLELWDEYEENQITSGVSITHVANDYYRITWTPGAGQGGWYWLVVSSTNNNGFYRLSVNDADPSNPYTYWADGLLINHATNVTLSGSNTFMENELAGIYSETGGNVTLANVNAWDNGTEGIRVDNLAGSGSVTILGSNVIAKNGWTGLDVATNGVVKISNLYSNGNGLDGLFIDANGYGKAVTLTNIVAMWNGKSGIEMEEGDAGADGIVTLNGVRAWFNNWDGASIDNEGWKLVLMNSSFMCNNGDGFTYWDYPAPFVFVNLNNIFLGNGDENLVVN